MNLSAPTSPSSSPEPQIQRPAYQISNRLAALDLLRRTIAEGTFARFRALVQFENDERDLLRRAGGLPRSRCLDLVRVQLARPENMVFGNLNLYIMAIDAISIHIRTSNIVQSEQVLLNTRLVLDRIIDNADVEMLRDGLLQYAANLMVIVSANPQSPHFVEWQQNLMTIEQAIRQIDLTLAIAWTDNQGFFRNVFQRLQTLDLNENQTNQPR